jgi:hypothetical protein
MLKKSYSYLKKSYSYKSCRQVKIILKSWIWGKSCSHFFDGLHDLGSDWINWLFINCISLFKTFINFKIKFHFIKISIIIKYIYLKNKNFNKHGTHDSCGRMGMLLVYFTNTSILNFWCIRIKEYSYRVIRIVSNLSLTFDKN